MSSGWVSGGPEWLFGAMLDGLAWGFLSGVAFLGLQANARAPFSMDLFGKSRRQALGLGAFIVAWLGSTLAFQDLPEALGPVLLMLVLSSATYATARAAYRQGEPTGEPIPWTRMTSPWKWTVPVIGAGALVVAGWSFAAMMLMGHSA